MNMVWSEVEQQLAAYKGRTWVPIAVAAAFIVLPLLFIFPWAVEHMRKGAGVVCLMGFASIGCATGAIISLFQGVVCPYCKHRIQYGSFGRNERIDELLKTHSCPFCKQNFPG